VRCAFGKTALQRPFSLMDTAGDAEPQKLFPVKGGVTAVDEEGPLAGL